MIPTPEWLYALTGGCAVGGCAAFAYVLRKCDSLIDGVENWRQRSAAAEKLAADRLEALNKQIQTASHFCDLAQRKQNAINFDISQSRKKSLQIAAAEKLAEERLHALNLAVEANAVLQKERDSWRSLTDFASTSFRMVWRDRDAMYAKIKDLRAELQPYRDRRAADIARCKANAAAGGRARAAKRLAQIKGA